MRKREKRNVQWRAKSRSEEKKKERDRKKDIEKRY